MNKFQQFFRPTTQDELAELAKKLTPPDDIRDLVPIPGRPEDWLFYGVQKKAQSFFSTMAAQTKRFGSREYWTKVNAIEAISFTTKISIIFPGLLFGKQWWWLYLFALVSSAALVATSTIKTLPTIIWFNIIWIVLASLSIAKHFIQ